METKEFNGKALYRPKGRSGEYARWAINFYNGCTGGCEYCYNKRFPLLSGPTPTLKACFKDEEDAYNVATSEILQNKDDIVRDGGVFLSFVSDPCDEHALKLTLDIVRFCSDNNIPVTVLTKRADWVLNPACKSIAIYNAFRNNLPKDAEIRKRIAFGFTLTGHDEMEPGCDCNEDRITAMEDLHNEGFRTWASIEPIIDFKSSLAMIEACAPFCDHFKIGIRTDRRFECTVDEVVDFVNSVRKIVNETKSTVYFKQSFRDLIGGGTIIGTQFVEDGYNMFSGKGPDYKKIFTGR